MAEGLSLTQVVTLLRSAAIDFKVEGASNIMIHFTCDGCHRPLNPDHEARYVIRVEAYAALDANEADWDDDRDHLEEIQDILARMEDDRDEEIGEDVYQQIRFDLCSECRRKFLRNPLGRGITPQLDFSQN